MTTFHQPPDRFDREDGTTRSKIQQAVEGGDSTAQHQMRELFDAYDPEYAHATGEEDYDADPEIRQRKRYGGVNWGAGLFGWLDCVAVAVLLTGGAAAALTVLGRTADAFPTTPSGAHTLSTAAVGGCFAVLLVAYLSGGYVAGRMSRFDGGKQGVGLWVVGLLLTAAAVGALLMSGTGAAVPSGLHLPRVTSPSWAHGAGALVVVATALLTSLLAAMAGGVLGCRYHRKVDDLGYVTG